MTNVCTSGGIHLPLNKTLTDDTSVKQAITMAGLRHILMGRNGDYFLNYIDYSKFFDAVPKLLLII